MLALLAAAAPLALTGCARPSEGERADDARLVFVHQPLGNPAALEGLLDGFRRENPAVRLTTTLLPNASDVAHQFFLTALEGGSRDFDVLVVDVIWVAEFARAGWLADLSSSFPPDRLAAELLAGPAEAATVGGRVYAVPWYVDVGVLYYRTDLVPRAPRTYDELRSFAADVRGRHPALHGYVWQGRQYEGLVCNVYEALWGHGGQTMSEDRLLLDTAAARKGLGYLRGLISDGISPRAVASSAEEDARRVFEAGRAVFMRNWPYAFAEAQREGSPVRGRVGFAPLPTESGEPGWGTLGGWLLAVNANAPPERRALAVRLVAHLTSVEANLTMAEAYGRPPPRREAYEGEALARRAPLIAALHPMLERARPRPVTPYYNLLADTLQGEFSAAIVGVRPPDVALRRAQAWADRLTAEGGR